KLTILCAQAFRLRVDPGDIVTRSSRSITPADIDVARGAGAAIRQLAYAAYDWTRQTLTAWVAPAIVPRESVFGDRRRLRRRCRDCRHRRRRRRDRCRHSGRHSFDCARSGGDHPRAGPVYTTGDSRNNQF
ncbi:MAG: hypothetical protein DMF97_03260, partial [Acidobacteria bacterium]